MHFEISTPYGNIKYSTNQMNHHALKTWKPFFQDVLSGIKTFELRKNDRNYQVGDTLQLIEVEADTLAPTGRHATVEIIYMLIGEEWGLQPGYVVLGIK